MSVNNVNNENYQYLTEEVFPRLGFVQVLDDQLLSKMKNGGEEIKLTAIGNFGNDGKDQVKYDFNLNYSQNDNRYYLNSITGTLTKEDGSSIKHDFQLFSQKGYGADEMYNMLDDRFVYKTFRNNGETVGKWSKIDPTRKDDNGNNIIRNYYDNTTHFNIVIEVGRLPLIINSAEDKEKLVRNLQIGDQGIANIRMPNGSKERVFLEARPDIGKIIIRNKTGERISLGDRIQPQEKQKFIVKDENTSPDIPPITATLMEKINAPEPADKREKRIK